jgi:hypothetical protein
MAVALIEDEVYLGDLCLYCLATQLGGRTGKPYRPADQVSPPEAQSVPESQPDHERLSGEGQNWRGDIRVGQLGALADRIGGMQTSGVSLAGVQQAEKDTLHNLFPGLREEDLCRLVDDRYREVLWPPA